MPICDSGIREKVSYPNFSDNCKCMSAAAAAKSLQSCPTLCNPTDCSPPGSSVHGILQARILEWVPCPSPGDLPDPGIEPMSLMPPVLAGGFYERHLGRLREA